MSSSQASLIKFITIVLLKLSFLGVVLRGKKEEGALAKVKKIKKRLSQSFGKLCKFSKILFSLTPLGFEAVNLSTNVFNFDQQQFCFSSRQILNCAEQQSTAGFCQIVFQLTLWDYMKSQTAGKLINWNRN